MASAAFASAVAFVSTSSAPSTPSTKLKLYALYKIATSTLRPVTPRPALWSLEGRAKWDAWDAEGSSGAYGDVHSGRRTAEERYVELAKGLGFAEDVEGNATRSKEQTKGAKGMVSVSSMAAEELVEGSSSELHDFAVDGKADAVCRLLAAPGGRATIDAKDAYGYTALHLASDRGHLEVVRALIDAGADRSLLDEDGQTALELATEAEHPAIAALLT